MEIMRYLPMIIIFILIALAIRFAGKLYKKFAKIADNFEDYKNKYPHLVESDGRVTCCHCNSKYTFINLNVRRACVCKTCGKSLYIVSGL